ncbi:hypothetical protein ABB02_01814 [Clostridiaceae bacterium JG1575]|nr:hypothetical protein ABB02_01814 [Clostridiaceae bacterium JG1575]
MEIIGKRIKLRPFRESDIDDHIRWRTQETEWMDWDAPWEENDFNIEEFRKSCLARLETNAPSSISSPKEIEILATKEHIGRVNTYTIDENYDYSRKGTHWTIGIDIYDPSNRKQGYGTEAWWLYIRFLLENGPDDIYTQTWSGNYPVLALMQKLGFELIHTKEAYQIVAKKRVDGLTYKLNKDIFQAALNEWKTGS